MSFARPAYRKKPRGRTAKALRVWRELNVGLVERTVGGITTKTVWEKRKPGSG